MKRAEIIMTFMDELKKFIAFLNEGIEKGIELFEQAKIWVSKMIEYLEIRIRNFVDSVRGRTLDLIESSDDYMFV
ncbi:hypothetical protein J2X31_000556 [Flavobacterium arsenatis]|uniref:Uncharacterized protein n=1 Tax=Flavobacterium arsenatis TaxID=1484332 RepID=A0ABU1TL14_9FLAO|nr:hypothetical protein [Flavobacterium arsenatis]MDR6966558.1 hypothetical protein [Flavobacterium arsenatis]